MGPGVVATAAAELAAKRVVELVGVDAVEARPSSAMFYSSSNTAPFDVFERASARSLGDPNMLRIKMGERGSATSVGAQFGLDRLDDAVAERSEICNTVRGAKLPSRSPKNGEMSGPTRIVAPNRIETPRPTAAHG
jgi:hypothetical protein